MLQSFGAVVMSCVQTFKGGREELHRDLWIIYHVFGEYKWIHLIIAEGLVGDEGWRRTVKNLIYKINVAGFMKANKVI